MEAVDSSETLITTNKTTRYHRAGWSSVTLWNCIRELLGSSFSRNISYPDWGPSQVSSHRPDKCWVTTAFLQNLSNWSFTNHPTIQYYIVYSRKWQRRKANLRKYAFRKTVINININRSENVKYHIWMVVASGDVRPNYYRSCMRLVQYLALRLLARIYFSGESEILSPKVTRVFSVDQTVHFCIQFWGSYVCGYSRW